MMQSALRKPVAAAALLLSAAAALMAQPALAHDHDGDGHDGWHHAAQGDERAPMIRELTPRPGERVGNQLRTTVSARFRDEASGVDPASVRLHIDGHDVTGSSRIDDDEVRFHNNLFPGRHVAEVVVRDRAGNTARRSWQFELVDREHERHDRYDHRDRFDRHDRDGDGRWDGQR
jgi:hypothetical protein